MLEFDELKDLDIWKSDWSGELHVVKQVHNQRYVYAYLDTYINFIEETRGSDVARSLPWSREIAYSFEKHYHKVPSEDLKKEIIKWKLKN